MLADRPSVQPGQDVVDPQVVSSGVVEGEADRRLGEQRLEQSDGRLHRSERAGQVRYAGPAGRAGRIMCATPVMNRLMDAGWAPRARSFELFPDSTRVIVVAVHAGAVHAGAVGAVHPVGLVPGGSVTRRSGLRMSRRLLKERGCHGKRLWPVWQRCSQGPTSDVFGH